MTASSSGVVLPERFEHFSGVNLLELRTADQEATLRESLRSVRVCALIALAILGYFPWTWGTSVLRNEVAQAHKQAEKARKGHQIVSRQAADLTPALQYAQRLEASRQNRTLWMQSLRTLEAGVGPSGFVSAVSVRVVTDGFETEVVGEAPSLSAAHQWISSLRRNKQFRDLRLSRVQPAERLSAATGAVRYEVRGRVKMR